MTLHRIAVGITLGLMLTVATGWADDDRSHGKQIRIKGSFAGSFSPSAFDFNSDGQKAGVDFTTSTSNLGSATNHCQSEYLPALPTPITCSPGTLEFPLIAINCVSTNTITLEQLFAFYSSGSLCVDPNTGAFTAKVQGDFVGGTGRYTGATGSVQNRTTGFFFVCDPAGGCFGNETGTFTGTLTFP